MKAVLEYNLPDDEDRFKMACRSVDLSNQNSNQYALTSCATKTPTVADIDRQIMAETQTRLNYLTVPARSGERKSQIELVKASQPFLANCDTYSRTAADMLVDQGLEPEEVWIVQGVLKSGSGGFARTAEGWKRVGPETHQVVMYKGMVIDNRWPGVLTLDDLKYEYRWTIKQNLDGYIKSGIGL